MPFILPPQPDGSEGPAVAFAAVVGGLGLLLLAELAGARAGPAHPPAWVRPLRALSKAAASTGFVALACCAGASSSPAGRWLLLALALSWLGDMALLGHASSAFLAGLGAFLLAHLAFVAGFVSLGTDALWLAASLPPLGLLAYAIWRWLGPHVGAIRGPVLAYIAAISAMVATAAAACGARPDAAGALLLGGALVFMASDLAVARDRFVAPGLANRLWGLPLYYLAQLLLTAGVLAR